MRLSGMPYFEQITSIVFAEMVAALRTAYTEAVCVSAIDELQVDLDQRPTVGQIKRAISSRNASEPPPEENRGFCDRCGNGQPRGWITATQTVKGNEYTLSGRCKCQPGGWV